MWHKTSLSRTTKLPVEPAGNLDGAVHPKGVRMFLNSRLIQALVVACSLFMHSAFSQGLPSPSSPEVGMFHGVTVLGAPIFVSVDSQQRVGFATPKAVIACDEAVRVLYGSGSGVYDTDGSVLATIDARCPDKSARNFDVRIEYDPETDTSILTLPGSPLFPPVEMERIGFNHEVFYNAIQDLKNESSLIMHSLFEAFDNSTQCTIAVVHNNGYDQSWIDCDPLGTYNLEQAKEACGAYTRDLAQCQDLPNQCNSGSDDVVCGPYPSGSTSNGDCACWSYSGASVGTTFNDPSSDACLCPLAGDTVWQ